MFAVDTVDTVNNKQYNKQRSDIEGSLKDKTPIEYDVEYKYIYIIYRIYRRAVREKDSSKSRAQTSTLRFTYFIAAGHAGHKIEQ